MWFWHIWDVKVILVILLFDCPSFLANFGQKTVQHFRFCLRVVKALGYEKDRKLEDFFRVKRKTWVLEMCCQWLAMLIQFRWEIMEPMQALFTNLAIGAVLGSAGLSGVSWAILNTLTDHTSQNFKPIVWRCMTWFWCSNGPLSHGPKHSKKIHFFCGPMVLCLCQSMCLALTGGGAGIAADTGSDGFHFLVWPFGILKFCRGGYSTSEGSAAWLLLPHVSPIPPWASPKKFQRRILARFWKSCQKCRKSSASRQVSRECFAYGEYIW